MFKFIFDLATEPLGLPIEWYYEWIILLVIGEIAQDDDGNVVGIDNARDLLERIPNKITDTMGIIADVNLLYKGELEYLQIIVDKYPSLISFRGKYYYRSGSTMREITGKELERALLKTQGRTWDGVPLPKL